MAHVTRSPARIIVYTGFIDAPGWMETGVHCVRFCSGWILRLASVLLASCLVLRRHSHKPFQRLGGAWTPPHLHTFVLGRVAICMPLCFICRLACHSHAFASRRASLASFPLSSDVLSWPWSGNADGFAPFALHLLCQCFRFSCLTFFLFSSQLRYHRLLRPFSIDSFFSLLISSHLPSSPTSLQWPPFLSFLLSFLIFSFSLPLLVPSIHSPLPTAPLPDDPSLPVLTHISFLLTLISPLSLSYPLPVSLLHPPSSLLPPSSTLLPSSSSLLPSFPSLSPHLHTFEPIPPGFPYPHLPIFIILYRLGENYNHKTVNDNNRTCHMITERRP